MAAVVATGCALGFAAGVSLPLTAVFAAAAAAWMRLITVPSCFVCASATVALGAEAEAAALWVAALCFYNNERTTEWQLQFVFACNSVHPLKLLTSQCVKLAHIAPNAPMHTHVNTLLAHNTSPLLTTCTQHLTCAVPLFSGAAATPSDFRAAHGMTC